MEVNAGGAVFETARDAERNLREQKTSADCGTYTDGPNSIDVAISSISPTLVGCRCQNVNVYEVLVTPPDNATTTTQYIVQAQQDRYVSEAFISIPTILVEDGAERFAADLIDEVVKNVSEVAEEAQR